MSSHKNMHNVSEGRIMRCFWFYDGWALLLATKLVQHALDQSEIRCCFLHQSDRKPTLIKTWLPRLSRAFLDWGQNGLKVSDYLSDHYLFVKLFSLSQSREQVLFYR